MKICLVLSTSRKKIWLNDNQPFKIEAKNAYIGNNFRKARKIAETFSLDYFIISAKYGLMDKNTLIENYEMKIKSRRAALEIKNDFKGKLKELEQNYDKIILVGGTKYYRMVFEDIKEGKFSFLKVKNQGDLGNKLKIILDSNSLETLINQ